MKKIILIFSTILLSQYAYSFDEQEIRKRFYESVESAKVAKSFLEDLKSTTNESNQPLIDGYRAATCMVMAKHVFNPYSKFKYFSDGKKLLEKTISKFPENTELRLIRFAIQINVPNFLGYYKEINDDKLFLINNFSKLDTKSQTDNQLRIIIKEYLIKSGLCTAGEIIKIQS